MAIIHLNSENFEAAVSENEVIIIDFYANWCGPCRMLGEVLEEVSSTHPEVVIGKVNVDENRALAMKFQVRSIPQLYVYKNGQIVKNISGYVGADVILEAIK